MTYPPSRDDGMGEKGDLPTYFVGKLYHSDHTYIRTCIHVHTHIYIYTYHREGDACFARDREDSEWDR